MTIDWLFTSPLLQPRRCRCISTGGRLGSPLSSQEYAQYTLTDTKHTLDEKLRFTPDRASLEAEWSEGLSVLWMWRVKEGLGHIAEKHGPETHPPLLRPDLNVLSDWITSGQLVQIRSHFPAEDTNKHSHHRNVLFLTGQHKSCENETWCFVSTFNSI